MSSSLIIPSPFTSRSVSYTHLDVYKRQDLCGITREGVSFLDISYAAEKIGLRTVAVKATMENQMCIRDRNVVSPI